MQECWINVYKDNLRGWVLPGHIYTTLEDCIKYSNRIDKTIQYRIHVKMKPRIISAKEYLNKSS